MCTADAIYNYGLIQIVQVQTILQKRFNLYMGPHKIIHAAEFNLLINIPEYVSTIIDDQITANLASHIHNDMIDENH